MGVLHREGWDEEPTNVMTANTGRADRYGAIRIGDCSGLELDPASVAGRATAGPRRICGAIGSSSLNLYQIGCNPAERKGLL